MVAVFVGAPGVEVAGGAGLALGAAVADAAAVAIAVGDGLGLGLGTSMSAHAPTRAIAPTSGARNADRDRIECSFGFVI